MTLGGPSQTGDLAPSLTRGFLFADLRGYTSYVEAPEDAAMLVHRQHDELREQVARERLARARQPTRPGVAVHVVPHVGVAHRFWAGAQHLLHPHPTPHGA